MSTLPIPCSGSLTHDPIHDPTLFNPSPFFLSHFTPTFPPITESLCGPRSLSFPTPGLLLASPELPWRAIRPSKRPSAPTTPFSGQIRGCLGPFSPFPPPPEPTTRENPRVGGAQREPRPACLHPTTISLPTATPRGLSNSSPPRRKPQCQRQQLHLSATRHRAERRREEGKTRPDLCPCSRPATNGPDEKGHFLAPPPPPGRAEPCPTCPRLLRPGDVGRRYH